MLAWRKDHRVWWLRWIILLPVSCQIFRNFSQVIDRHSMSRLRHAIYSLAFAIYSANGRVVWRRLKNLTQRENATHIFHILAKENSKKKNTTLWTSHRRVGAPLRLWIQKTERSSASRKMNVSRPCGLSLKKIACRRRRYVISRR